MKESGVGKLGSNDEVQFSITDYFGREVKEKKYESFERLAFSQFAGCRRKRG
jgi:hypothetical protein